MCAWSCCCKATHGYGESVLIAEDLLLLLLDDKRGTAQSTFMQPALGGALLVELALAEVVDVGPGSYWRPAKVSVVAGAPADAVLAAAVATVAEKPRTAQKLVDRLGRGLQKNLADRLVDRGILERHDTRVLGIFPRHRWPTVDATHEEQVRRQLAAALVGGQDPDPRTAALAALLLAVDRVHKTVPHEGLSSRQVKRRATEIAEGDWAVKGVKDAVRASQAAVMAAVAASSTAATAGS